MEDENHIRTIRDYSKPSHEGYRNTIELPAGNNMVPLRSDTIWLVQNGCSFHVLQSEDPNQHLKDFLKLVDSLDLDGENRERTRLSLSIGNPDVPTTSWRISIRSMDSFQGSYSKSPSSCLDICFKSKSFMIMSIPSQDEPLTNRPVVSFMTSTPKNLGHY
ncbi:hypothetical protein Tco_0972930 [Tanacetum coccineum]